MDMTVGSSIVASLKPLVHRRNVASVSLFYWYYFGRSLFEPAELVPLPYSRRRDTKQQNWGWWVGGRATIGPLTSLFPYLLNKVNDPSLS